MLEKECDEILIHFYSDFKDNHKGKHGQMIENELIAFYPHYDPILIKTVFSILFSEKFIELTYHDGCHWYSITFNGIAFVHTDTFVDRKKRWDLEKNTNILEYNLKKKTFTIAVIALIISVASFLISLAKCNDSHNDSENRKWNADNQSHISNGIHNL